MFCYRQFLRLLIYPLDCYRGPPGPLSPACGARGPLKLELLFSGKRFIILIKSCEAFIPIHVKNKGKFSLFWSCIWYITLLNKIPPLDLSFSIVSKEEWGALRCALFLVSVWIFLLPFSSGYRTILLTGVIFNELKLKLYRSPSFMCEPRTPRGGWGYPKGLEFSPWQRFDADLSLRNETCFKKTRNLSNIL
jgi:hypothetical protein